MNTSWWRSARGPLAVIGALLVVSVLGALVAGGSERGELDPDSVAPGGSRALATLLGQEGVDVQRVTTAAEAADRAEAGSTVLVVWPERILPEEARRLARSGADLVLVAPSTPEDFVEGITARGLSGMGEARPPACRLPAAVRAGTADVTAVTYDVDPSGGAGTALCYSRDGFPALAVLTSDGATSDGATSDGATSGAATSGAATTVLGDVRPLRNANLGEHGNAALAMNLLGANPDLVWYLPPVIGTATDDGPSLLSLVPPWVWWALAQVTVAVGLAAVWRARRLGPVVAEALPVVVRAAEATEGRARLYRRFRSRDRASAALRDAARNRLGRRLALPRAASPPEVLEALARRTGRHPGELDALLYGAAPTDDATLVRLADALDTLEREVHRS